jgi:hypothetical protein
MTPDNSGMPPLPEPRQDLDTIGGYGCGYDAQQMHDYGRQVAQMCAETADEWGNYALASELRSAFGLEKP